MKKSFVYSVALAACVCMAPLTSPAQIMTGAYIKSNSWDTTAMAEFETATAKDMAVINIYTNFDYDWNTLYWQCSNIIQQGAVPMITVEPTISARPGDNLLFEVLEGDWDAYLDTWIQGFLGWAESQNNPDLKVMLRFAHEFNGIWYPWSNTPNEYIAAWRYVHNRFENAAANGYLEWVWNANHVSVDDYSDITRYYPGSDVVDWTSLDGYNWGSNYSFSEWRSFAELFSAQYAVLMSQYPDKPVLIAEVGSTEPGDVPNPSFGQDGDISDSGESTSAWVSDMFAQLPMNFPAVKGLVWFNINKELSWAITEPNSTGLTAYATALQDPYISNDYLSSDDYTPPGQGKRMSMAKSTASAATVQAKKVEDKDKEKTKDTKKDKKRYTLKQEAAGFKQLSLTAIEERREKHNKMIDDAHAEKGHGAADKKK